MVNCYNKDKIEYIQYQIKRCNILINYYKEQNDIENLKDFKVKKESWELLLKEYK